VYKRQSLNDNYRDDIKHLLDFAIIGHGKSATTKLMNWLVSFSSSSGNETQPDGNTQTAKPIIQMPNHEIHFLTHGEPGLFVEELFKLQTTSTVSSSHGKVLVGYKSPNDIEVVQSRNLLQRYFPLTRLIVGVRHPVTWFQSWYNFHSRLDDQPLPNAETYGRTIVFNTTTNTTDIQYNLPYHAMFHVHLALMRKTARTDPREWELLDPFVTPTEKSMLLKRSNDLDCFNDSCRTMNHHVLLYESTQPFDHNTSRRIMFANDLGRHIGLMDTDKHNPRDKEGILPPLKDATNYQSRNYSSDIDICDDRYRQVRADLLELGTAAATWILDHFLPLESVHVSSPQHFQELLHNWSVDPCMTGDA